MHIVNVKSMLLLLFFCCLFIVFGVSVCCFGGALLYLYLSST